MKRTLPDWVDGDLKQYRLRKRQEVRDAIAAVKELHLGCAFAPGGEKVVKALELLREVKEEMSVKRWRLKAAATPKGGAHADS